MSENVTKKIFYGVLAIFGGAAAVIGQMLTDRKIEEQVDKKLKERETN